jgi:hypothetical protein
MAMSRRFDAEQVGDRPHRHGPVLVQSAEQDQLLLGDPAFRQRGVQLDPAVVHCLHHQVRHSKKTAQAPIVRPATVRRPVLARWWLLVGLTAASTAIFGYFLPQQRDAVTSSSAG